MNKKEENKIKFESRNIGKFEEKISKKGKHYFKGFIFLHGRYYDVLLFQNNHPKKNVIYAMLSSKESNYD